MSSRKLGQKMALVAHSWLHDPVRPHLQLSTLLEALSKHPKLTPQAVRAAQALQNNQAYKKVESSPANILRPIHMVFSCLVYSVGCDLETGFCASSLRTLD